MGPLRLALLLAAAVFCANCNRSQAVEDRSSENIADATLQGAVTAPTTNANMKSGETYAEYDARRNDLDGSAGSYGGYGCTEDCSGHEAGYSWAADQGITDPDDCGGKSWSFEEGCRAYAEDQSGDAEDPADDQSEDDGDPSE